MWFRQYELGCLSLMSYMIGDEATGRAVVVDPQRDISQYLDDARHSGLRIERVVETHFHADFVSGHLELAEATGATISYGEGAQAAFEIDTLRHGQQIPLGDVLLEVRATPGHTPESISLVVWEHRSDPEPWGVLTGDTLFVGDVGRPDLLASAGWSAGDLAARLYRSIRDELLSLPDSTRVFPAHGAGSSCGRHMSSATVSTIGEQRATNYALAPKTEEEFVAAVLEGQSSAPPYFAFAAMANRSARQLLDDHEPPRVLDLEEVLALAEQGAVLLDSRPPETFASGHLKGSVNVGLEGRFAEYAGDVVRPEQEVVVVADPGRESETRLRLARIGYDRVAGYLPQVERQLAERADLARSARRVPAVDLAGWRSQDTGVQLVDVRTPGEFEAGHLAGAIPLPLSALLERMDELDRDRPTVVYCAGGYRSSMAASLLSASGFSLVGDVLGGYDAWAAAGLPVESGAPTDSGRHR